MIALGEVLVEIMRKELDVSHNVPGVYLGPYPSGAPAIFIDTVARLGSNAGFIGVVGDDDFGELLVDRLRGDGVDVSYLRITEGYTTGTAFVMYYSSGSRRFIFHLRHAAAGQLCPEDVKKDYIADSKILHIMGSALSISESSREACYKAARIAHESNITVTLDPNLRPELLDVETIRRICKPVLQVSRIVFPSKLEATTLTGIKDPIKAGKSLIEMGPEMAVVKMGSKGAITVTGEEITYEPAFDVSEIDPTGAGDIYDGAFVHGLLQGWTLRRIMEFASAAGAIKVTRFGPMNGPSSRKEVEQFIQEHKKRINSEELEDSS